MRSMAHPDYQRQPWSEERKKAASERAKQRLSVVKKETAEMSKEQMDEVAFGVLSEQFADYVRKGEHTQSGTAAAILKMSAICPNAFRTLDFKDRFAMASAVIAQSKQSISFYTDMAESARKDLRLATEALNELLSELGDFLEDETP